MFSFWGVFKKKIRIGNFYHFKTFGKFSPFFWPVWDVLLCRFGTFSVFFVCHFWSFANLRSFSIYFTNSLIVSVFAFYGRFHSFQFRLFSSFLTIRGVFKKMDNFFSFSKFWHFGDYLNLFSIWGRFYYLIILLWIGTFSLSFAHFPQFFLLFLGAIQNIFISQ